MDKLTVLSRLPDGKSPKSDPDCQYKFVSQIIGFSHVNTTNCRRLSCFCITSCSLRLSPMSSKTYHSVAPNVANRSYPPCCCHAHPTADILPTVSPTPAPLASKIENFWSPVRRETGHKKCTFRLFEIPTWTSRKREKKYGQPQHCFFFSFLKIISRRSLKTQRFNSWL